jgi:hypothetical protein
VVEVISVGLPVASAYIILPLLSVANTLLKFFGSAVEVLWKLSLTH